MAGTRVKVSYLEEGRGTVTVALSSGDKIRAKRDLRGSYAGDDEVTARATWNALQRTGAEARVAGAADVLDEAFLDWCDAVAEINVQFTHELIDQLLATGEITAETAERMHAEADEAEGEVLTAMPSS